MNPRSVRLDKQTWQFLQSCQRSSCCFEIGKGFKYPTEFCLVVHTTLQPLRKTVNQQMLKNVIINFLSINFLLIFCWHNHRNVMPLFTNEAQHLKAMDTHYKNTYSQMVDSTLQSFRLYSVISCRATLVTKLANY